MVDFNALRLAYNAQIDTMLADEGLSSECKLNYGKYFKSY